MTSCSMVMQFECSSKCILFLCIVFWCPWELTFACIYPHCHTHILYIPVYLSICMHNIFPTLILSACLSISISEVYVYLFASVCMLICLFVSAAINLFLPKPVCLLASVCLSLGLLDDLFQCIRHSHVFLDTPLSQICQFSVICFFKFL